MGTARAKALWQKKACWRPGRLDVLSLLGAQGSGEESRSGPDTLWWGLRGVGRG